MFWLEINVITDIVLPLLFVVLAFALDKYCLKSPDNDTSAISLIKLLLKNPTWEKRTFIEVKKRIGGFDDDHLRRLLLKAGAMRFYSSDKRELWGFPEGNSKQSGTVNFMKDRFIRAVKGQEKLWVIFWIYQILIGLVINAIAVFSVSNLDNAFTFIAISLKFCWFLFCAIGIWQCAFNTDYRFLGYFARVAAVLSVYGLFAPFLNLI